VSVNGNGPYNSPNFTPSTAGTYRWIANYSGDANNDATHNLCNGANEDVIVQPNQSHIDTAQNLLPNDNAHVIGASVMPTGNVTFQLFDNSGCTGTVYYSETVALSALAGLTATADTHNTGPPTGFLATGDNTTWYWKVSYPGDQNNTASESCKEFFTIDNG
jgi:hypothetical protein